MSEIRKNSPDERDVTQPGSATEEMSSYAHEEGTASESVYASSGSASASRGRTVLPNSVVARIAAQAAFEVSHVGSASGGVAGVGARRDFSTRPDASCEIYGDSTVVHLDVGVDFPVPLGDVLAEVRDHVTTTVATLTGLGVSRLDIDVSWLHPADSTRRLL